MTSLSKILVAILAIGLSSAQSDNPISVMSSSAYVGRRTDDRSFRQDRQSGSANNPIAPDGTYRGVRLCGRVRICNQGEQHSNTFRVRTTTSFPDLYVTFTNPFPSDIGEWTIVDNGEDFSVIFVDYSPDFEICINSQFHYVR